MSERKNQFMARDDAARDPGNHDASANDASGTWHYGLIARWWAEFNEAEPEELAYYAAAIRRFGQPALDLGCGTGRILLPLLAAGLDIDGVDISPDMLAFADSAAIAAGFAPTLTAQAMHELDLGRTYRTIYMCGAFGIGGRRDHELEGLRRAYRHLEPGGVLLINHELPYAGIDEGRWALWLPHHRGGIPRKWPGEGDRRRAADGDEIELISRLVEFDPLNQRHTLEMQARLWHAGTVIREETSRLSESLYFAQEILTLLVEAGFAAVEMEDGYSGRAAAPDSGILMFVARKQ
jgi:SAM-dependent methyltransferase